jgi:hypothetical protein
MESAHEGHPGRGRNQQIGTELGRQRTATGGDANNAHVRALPRRAQRSPQGLKDGNISMLSIEQLAGVPARTGGIHHPHDSMATGTTQEAVRGLRVEPLEEAAREDDGAMTSVRHGSTPSA